MANAFIAINCGIVGNPYLIALRQSCRLYGLEKRGELGRGADYRKVLDFYAACSTTPAKIEAQGWVMQRLLSENAKAALLRAKPASSPEVVQCEAGYSRRKAVIGWMLKARRAGM